MKNGGRGCCGCVFFDELSSALCWMYRKNSSELEQTMQTRMHLSVALLHRQEGTSASTKPKYSREFWQLLDKISADFPVPFCKPHIA